MLHTITRCLRGFGCSDIEPSVDLYRVSTHNLALERERKCYPKAKRDPKVERELFLSRVLAGPGRGSACGAGAAPKSKMGLR